MTTIKKCFAGTRCCVRYLFQPNTIALLARLGERPRTGVDTHKGRPGEGLGENWGCPACWVGHGVGKGQTVVSIVLAKLEMGSSRRRRKESGEARGEEGDPFAVCGWKVTAAGLRGKARVIHGVDLKGRNSGRRERPEPRA